MSTPSASATKVLSDEGKAKIEALNHKLEHGELDILRYNTLVGSIHAKEDLPTPDYLRSTAPADGSTQILLQQMRDFRQEESEERRNPALTALATAKKVLLEVNTTYSRKVKAKNEHGVEVEVVNTTFESSLSALRNNFIHQLKSHEIEATDAFWVDTLLYATERQRHVIAHLILQREPLATQLVNLERATETFQKDLGCMPETMNRKLCAALKCEYAMLHPESPEAIQINSTLVDDAAQLPDPDLTVTGGRIAPQQQPRPTAVPACFRLREGQKKRIPITGGAHLIDVTQNPDGSMQVDIQEVVDEVNRVWSAHDEAHQASHDFYDNTYKQFQSLNSQIAEVKAGKPAHKKGQSSADAQPATIADVEATLHRIKERVTKLNSKVKSNNDNVKVLMASLMDKLRRRKGN